MRYVYTNIAFGKLPGREAEPRNGAMQVVGSACRAGKRTDQAAPHEQLRMAEAGIIRHASGDWNPGDDHVRLRIEAEKLEQPQDLLIALGDVQAFIVLLLVLSGKAGTSMRRDAESRPTLPLPIDSVGLGEAESGDTVLQLNIGQTTLAFAMPANASRKLGQSLLALSASSATSPAN
jgi:hypothetical protein